MYSKRYFSVGHHLNKQLPKNLKGKSGSSHAWLTRQLKDPYVEKAKMMNYRCRSAFKLLEMDNQFNIVTPGQNVIDLGCAPGSWTQVLVERTNSCCKRENTAVGFVMGIDRLPVYPLEGASFITADFTSEKTQELLKNKLQGKKIDVVLSDMAPNASGVQSLDHENIINLAVYALRFSVNFSSVGGKFVVKIWDGASRLALEKDIKRFYSNVRTVKPKASRNESSEIFFLARNFKGLVF